MNYEQGTLHMKNLAAQLKEGQKSFFIVGNLRIDYPGYKTVGDYRLSSNGKAPKHTDIVQFIYDHTNENNYNEIIEALSDIYSNGLLSTNPFFSKELKETIFWITLQEEINYPQPQYSGRKLPYQRFYEGALAKLKLVDLELVITRTNNHGKSRPVLFDIENYQPPVFYV